MADRETFVVVGAGQAGGRAAEAMRKAGFAGRVVVIGAERYVPYERPPLSKQLLIGDEGPERTFLHGADYYREHDIELRLGARATAIDREAHRVALADGEHVAYDRLLLTTGSRVRRLPVPGADLAGVHYLRDIDDSLAIRAGLGPDARVVVVGGGYIGLEVAAAARSRGARVTVLEMAPRLLARVVAPEIGAFYEDVHRRHGVDIRTGATVTGFRGEDRVAAVACDDGETIACDLAVVGVGIQPDGGLAEAAGLAVDDGVVVDEYGATSDPDVFAAGDVTRHPNPVLGRTLRLESWQNAQNQAIAVARAMCGGTEPYAEVPWFWSDQYDLNLQMVGIADDWDRLVWRGAPDDGRFIVFYLAGGAVAAANAVNSPRDLRYARRLIERKATPDPAALADPAVPLKSLIPD